jgi:hypothetical protein
MKTPFGITAKLLILLLAAFAVQCSEICTVQNVYYYAEPIYMGFAELRSSVKTEAPHELSNTGKIYFKDGYLYINEIDKGIHVIDNHDPSNPVAKSFIKIPGNYDLAIRNNILYADSYIDLVAIDISVIGQEKEVGRYQGLFTRYSPMGYTVNLEKGVITGVKISENASTISECDTQVSMMGGWGWSNNRMLFSADAASSVKGPSQNVQGGNSTGVGGSMARFTITGDRLYTIEPGELASVNLSNPTSPSLEKKVTTTWDTETIFPYNNNLFVGGRSGMAIYNLVDPAEPKLVTIYTHMRSCDPVVVEGNYAYVTLRNGNTCAGFTNQLEVIDIKELSKPVLLHTYPMTNPYGVGIDNNVLFVCDGKDGLKVFDATDKSKIAENIKAHYKDIQTFDIIPFNDIAMMIAEDGLYQYDYSDVKNIKFLSKLKVVKKEVQ